ncbi:MAG: hypothetical protein JW892_06725, partial [Anaerolineae bacterium]|nr:hypothetical protein [Anaerolineae bacterium]
LCKQAQRGCFLCFLARRRGAAPKNTLGGRLLGQAEGVMQTGAEGLLCSVFECDAEYGVAFKNTLGDR